MEIEKDEFGRVGGNTARKIMKELKKTIRKLERHSIDPLWHPHINGCYVERKCVSSYYDGSRQWFINHPKDEGDWEQMEKYTILDHALECPFPEECPSVKKALEMIGE